MKNLTKLLALLLAVVFCLCALTACLTLCEKWFDVTNPFGENTMTEEFFEQATDTVMKNGVFGFHNEENEVSHLTRTVSMGKLPYPLKIICLVLSNIFPSYEGMCDVPYYSFLKGRPWLLPAAWVYRWGYVIRHKFKHGMTVLTEPVGKRKLLKQSCWKNSSRSMMEMPTTWRKTSKRR